MQTENLAGGQNVAAILGQIAAMPITQQQALLAAWRAVVPVTFDGVSGGIAPAGLPLMSDKDDLDGWLESLASYSHDKQKEMLAEAIQHSGREEDTTKLREALSRLTVVDRSKTIQKSITELAFDRPYYFLFGTIAIFWLLARSVRGVWHFVS